MKNIYVVFTGLIWLFAGLLYARAGTSGNSPYPEWAAGAPAPTFTYTKTNVTTCNGATTGSITVTASGGAGNYSYSKDNGATFQASNQFTSLAAGTYPVLVKDGANVQSAAQSVTISQPDALTGRATSVTSTCPGLSTGALSFTAGGGTAPYQYALNNGAYQSSNVFTGLGAGNYLLSVKDANGCVISPATYQVTAPTAPTVTPVVTDISCNGRQDGAIRVDLTGGVNQGAATISIDNGATYINNTVFSALSAGTYKIIVKYANNCLTPVKEATVNQPATLSFTTQITGTISCNGGQTGAIQVTASGGNGTYSYSKDNGASYQTSNQFNDLSANTYRIAVTDSRNCPAAVQRVTISQPTALTYTLTKTDVSCYGGNDGSVSIEGQGGTGPYRYFFSDQAPASIRNPDTRTSSSLRGAARGARAAADQHTGLTAQTYYFTVYDANGCSNESTVAVNQPNPLTVERSVANVLCNGGSTGRITLTTAGGTPPYQYSRDGGTTFQDNAQFTGLPAGTYPVVVKDKNNCRSETQSVEITQPAALSFTTSKTDAVCAGGNTGSIGVTASGGTAPYQYSKDNGQSFQTSNSFTGLAAGSYQVLVKDANNCVSAAQSVNVGQPAALVFTTTKADVAGCNGDHTGSITATANGGTGAYQYSKDNGATFQTGNSFANLLAGTYQIVVKDANGCVSAAQTIIITQPAPLAYTVTLTNVSCYGGANGSITVMASGGTALYQYSKDNGATYQTSNSFTGLAAGSYQVLVKDANGCLAKTSTVTLTQPTALALTIEQANVNCNGAATGTIVAGASGGTAPYQYSKDNGATFQTGNSFANLPAGTYSVRIKDANNCLSGTQTVTITQPIALSLSAAQTNVTTCYGGNNGSITLTATGGTGTYQYSKDNGASFQSANTFTGLAAGSYQVLVKDANNCVSTAQTLVITQPTAVTFTTAKTDVTSCNGATTGAIVITASGGTGAYQYSKDNGSSFQTSNSFTGLAAGSYQVVAKDANGCLAPAQTVVINQPSPVTGSVVSTTQTCPGLNTGGLTANASGGTGAYQYALNNGTYQSGNVFTGLGVGNYTLSVKDANGCVYNGATYQITAPTAPTVTPTVTNLTCNGTPNGSIYVGTSGGVNVGQIFASINNGATYTTNIQFNNLAAGTYQVLVKYANNCLTSVQPVTVTQPAALSFSASVTSTINCYGNATGAITVTASGGKAPYQYSKDNGASYQDANLFGELVAGTYPIVVKDANGCVTPAQQVVLNQPKELTYTISKTDVTCFGAGNGTITIDAQGGTGPYQYVIVKEGQEAVNGGNPRPGTSGRQFTNLATGSYYVTITDANRCSVRTSLDISQPEALVFEASTSSVLCNGGSTGRITVTASGGTGAYQYSKDNGTTYQSASQFGTVAAGIYNVLVKDANNCVTTTQSVTVTQPAVLTAGTSKTNVTTCFGGNNGSIAVTASGGTAPYQYSKDNGSTFQSGNSFANLTAGTYALVVRDANGCVTAAQNVTIDQPAAVSFTTTKVNILGCNGYNTGSITVTASGGTGAYQYSKDNGATFQVANQFTTLSAGSYQVVVKDANGCVSAAQTVVITQPAQLAYTVAVTNVSCFGGANGSITVTASGGTAPYQYSKDNGATYQASNNFTGLGATSFQVLVKDASGCRLEAVGVTITQPNALSLSVESLNLSCNGAAMGSITVTGSGGVPAYQYSKDDGATYQAGNQFAGLAAGTYSVRIKDANACVSGVQSVNLTQPAALSLNVAKTNVMTCNGDATGSITVTASGGTGNYTYSKDNGASFQTSNQFTGLPAGVYTVLAKDANGCLSPAQSVTITQPAVLSLSVTATDTRCFGTNTGTLTVTASGGTAPYSYTHNRTEGFQTSNRFEFLSAEEYKVRVRDANGCVSGVQSVTINQPAQLTFVTTQTNVSCAGTNTGSITVTTSGGTGPYQYSKDNGTTFQTSNSFTGLTAGTYPVLVKDANGCVTTAQSITITQPDALSLSAESLNPRCNGEATGSITVTGSGGVPAYQYSKDNGATYQAGNQFAGLTAGSYSVRIKDANGCVSGVRSVNLTQPAALSLSVAKTNVTTCLGGNNGTITLTVLGSSGEYQYSINNGQSFQAANTFTGLAAGTYQALAMNGAGCKSDVQSLTLTQPSAVSFTTTKTDVLACNGSTTGSITVNGSGGTAPYQYSKDNGATFQSANQFTGLGVGSYPIVVKDASGCTAPAQTMVINQPDVLTMRASSLPVACFGASTGSISVTANGGTAPYQYSKDNGATYQSASQFAGLGASTYAVIVKDASGCVTTAQSITITQPAALAVTASKTDIVSCLDGNTGAISLSATGGTAPYQYSKDNGATYQADNSFTKLGAGVYPIVVKDANNCVTPAQSVTINQPQAITLRLAKTDVTTCNGDATGSLSLTASGGTGPYQYAKDNGATYQTSNQFGGLPAGVYTVLAKDASGCLSPAQSVTISQPSALNLSVAATDTRCFGTNTGALTITASGGTAPYSYTHDRTEGFRSSNQFENLSAGEYKVRVRDANGCVSGVQSVTINQPQQLTFVTAQTNVSCAGTNTGSISFSATGGTGAYQYSIDNGNRFQAGTQFTNLSAGSYPVLVKDANGCLSEAPAVVLTQPTTLAVTADKMNIVSCSDGNTGSISLNATGGTAPYQYSKDNGTTYQESPQFTGLSAGAYRLIVKDVNGCQAPVSATIVSPCCLSVTANPATIAYGQSTTLTATGCSGTISWTGGPQNSNVYVVSPTQTTSYTATCSIPTSGSPVTCTSVVTIMVNQPVCTLTTSAAPATITNGQSATLTASGCTGTVSWNGGPTTSNVYVVNPTQTTSYTATCSIPASGDPVTCTSVVTVVVNQPVCTIAAQASSNTIFNGQSATLTATGCANGTISWSNSPQTGSTLIVNPTTTTTYVATCAISTSGSPVVCSVPVSVTVVDRPECTLQVRSNPSTVFAGDPVTLTATGCTGTLQWSSGQSESIITVNPMGTATYSAVCTTVTPAGSVSCLATTTVTVIARPVCNLSLAASPTTVFNGQSATLTASGCEGGMINWNSQAGGESRIIVSPTATTTYSATCTLTTLAGSVSCTAPVTVTVTQPMLQIAGSGDVLPLNAATWAGTVTQNVGSFVWQYKTPTGDWQNFPATFDNNASILVSATSFLGSAAPTLIDQAIQVRAFSPYLISNVLTVIIRQQNPTIASLVTTKALCASTATGSFTLTVGRNLEPGESAFRARVFTLTNGAETLAATYTFAGTTFASPTIFAKGAYRVRLQSVIGSGSSAESTQDFTIDDGPALTVSVTKTDILCFGGKNGTINLVAGGGAGPYQYAINGGAFQPFQAGTQHQIANVTAGVYSIQLRDNNACSAAQPVSVTIAQPTASLTITSGTVKNPTGFQVNDGTITLQVTGGTPDYSFAWSVPNPAVSTQPIAQGVAHTITGLGDGNYTVVVTDKAGCTTQASYSLTQPSSILTKTTIVKAISCAGGANGIVQVEASGGVPRLSGDAYSYDWKIKGTTTSISQTSRLTNATSATYTVTVTDGNGVAKAFDVYLPEPLPVVVSVASLTNVACFGTATGGASLSIQGGVAPYVTRWNTQQTGLALTNMQAGRYVAVVTDANSCQAQASVQIQQPQALSATLASVNPSCYDICDGRIAATLTGGTTPYAVTWQNVASQALSLTGLCSGSYAVNVKDANGCVITQTTSLTRAVQKQIVMRTNTFICSGQTVDLDATIADGVSYVWTYPDGTTRTTPVVSVTSAGKYRVTATDKNGCTVTAQTSLSASATQAPTLAFAVASQIGVGEPLIAVNITNPRPAQTTWTIPASASLISSTDDRLEVVFKNTGTYPITMNGVQGQCEFKTTKMVTAVPASTVTTTAQTTPFIQELTILPNPNAGTFRVRIRLAGVSDVKLRVKPLLSTGADIYQQSAAGQQDYELSVSIPAQNLQTGNYLLTLETAKAIQTVKLLIAL